MDCLPDVSAAQCPAAAVSEIGLLIHLAELCAFFQKQTLLYEFSSQKHYMKTENARQNRSYPHPKKFRGLI